MSDQWGRPGAARTWPARKAIPAVGDPGLTPMSAAPALPGWRGVSPGSTGGAIGPSISLNKASQRTGVGSRVGRDVLTE
jgi:hypothetical protein